MAEEQRGDRIWLVLCTATGVAVDVTLNKYSSILPGLAVIGLWFVPFILFLVWIWRVEKTTAWVKSRFLEHPVSYIVMFLIFVPFAWQATATLVTKGHLEWEPQTQTQPKKLPPPAPLMGQSTHPVEATPQTAQSTKPKPKLDQQIPGKAPTGQQILNAPNGIGSIGGTLVNPTVNNFGPPPPVVQWHIERITSKNEVVISIAVDRAPEVPAFEAQCDSPCESLGAFAGTGVVYLDDSVNYRASDPNVAVVLLTPHVQLGKGTAITWLIGSKGGAPIKITNIELIPRDKAVNLPPPPPR